MGRAAWEHCTKLAGEKRRICGQIRKAERNKQKSNCICRRGFAGLPSWRSHSPSTSAPLFQTSWPAENILGCKYEHKRVLCSFDRDQNTPDSFNRRWLTSEATTFSRRSTGRSWKILSSSDSSGNPMRPDFRWSPSSPSFAVLTLTYVLL